MKSKILYKYGRIFLVLLILGFGFAVYAVYKEQSKSDLGEIPAQPPQTVSQAEIASSPANSGALGGYDVLIADRGNNRLIEVTPDKKIVWEYKFNLPKAGLGADDSFFTDNGNTVIVNLEEYHLIQEIDYKTKQVIWSYGVAGMPGSKDGFLNTPDDAYKLPNGDVTVADIKNCRILEISPDKKIVRQYGQTLKCSNANGFLDKPNADTPLPDGGMLISNIVGTNMIQLDSNWNKVFAMKLPLSYPSDPQPTKAGNILVANYANPGKIIEIDKTGKIVWQYGTSPGENLNQPSLAIELPNGNILANDDLNHRVIVIDKKTNQIVWQYGVTGKAGSAPGQLNVPDGVDIILRGNSSAQAAGGAGSVSSAQSANSPVLSIGALVRSASMYLTKQVSITGYLLKAENGYNIFSDESSGQLTKNDLPVVSQFNDNFVSGKKYILTGTLVDGGLNSVNNNPYHFVLSQPAQ